MSDVVVDNEELISTTRASQLSGYSKDYIGQLCRAEKLTCRRVSGHWYLSEKSLKQYQEGGAEDEETSTQSAYGMKVGNVRDDTFSYDGVEYIATSRAAELTGYAQDYIGQLARNGEIEGRKVGRRWFVSHKSLTAHKKHNDDLLAAVQAKASGVGGEDHTEETGDTTEVSINTNVEPGEINFNVKYVAETDQPLVPSMSGNSNYASGPYASGDIDPINRRKQRIRKIATQNSIEHSVEAHSQPARKPEIARQMEQTNTHSTDRSISSNWLSWLLLLLILIAAAIAAYLYLFGGNIPSFGTNFIDRTVSSSFISDLSDRFGDMFPGVDYQYTAE